MPWLLRPEKNSSVYLCLISYSYRPSNPDAGFIRLLWAICYAFWFLHSMSILSRTAIWYLFKAGSSGGQSKTVILSLAFLLPAAISFLALVLNLRSSTESSAFCPNGSPPFSLPMTLFVVFLSIFCSVSRIFLLNAALTAKVNLA